MIASTSSLDDRTQDDESGPLIERGNQNKDNSSISIVGGQAMDQELQVPCSRSPSYQGILDHMGPVGTWHIASLVLLQLPAMAAGILVLLLDFTALEPEAFRCDIKECDKVNPLRDGPVLAKFDDLDKSILEAASSYCRVPLVNESFSAPVCSLLSLDNVVGFTDCDPSNTTLLVDPFEFKETITTEFNLVCDRRYLITACGTMYMAGLLIGSFLGGPPADAVGRKPVLFGFIAVAGFSNFVGGLVSTIWPYAFFRMLAGIGEQGLTQMSFTLSVELADAKYKGIIGNLNQLVFALGTCLVGLIAFYVRTWRNLHFTTTALILPQILLWFWIPESPRWLASKGRWQDLQNLIDTCQRVNRRSNYVELSEIAEYRTSEEKQQEDKALNWGSMFTEKLLRIRSIIMMLIWGLVAFTYYGTGLLSGIIGGDIFLSFSMIALVEVVADFVNIFLIDHFGRRTTLVFMFLLSGLSCLSLGLIPDQSELTEEQTYAIHLTLQVLGKFGASAAFATCYVFTSELFPTSIRASAIGTCSIVSRIFTIFAPLASTYLPNLANANVPFLLFGSCGLLASILAIFVPESLGHPLPDNLQDVEQMNNDKKGFWSYWSTSKHRTVLRENMASRQS